MCVGIEPPDLIGQPRPLVHTIGHSTRPIDEFIQLLAEHDIQLLADVRTLPQSRSNPQFNSEALPATLAAPAIHYLHIGELGGLRNPRRLNEYGLAQCQLPWLCRLHADRPVPPRCRRPHPHGVPITHRNHVC